MNRRMNHLFRIRKSTHGAHVDLTFFSGTEGFTLANVGTLRLLPEEAALLEDLLNEGAGPLARSEFLPEEAALLEDLFSEDMGPLVRSSLPEEAALLEDLLTEGADSFLLTNGVPLAPYGFPATSSFLLACGAPLAPSEILPETPAHETHP